MPNGNEPDTSNTSVANTYISLDTATKLIKDYDGNTQADKVHDFIDNCEMALKAVNPNCKSVLFNIILTKLVGRARSLTKYRAFKEWSELKTYLEDVFSEKRSISFWQLELNSCRQGKQEDIGSYSNKIEKFLSNLIDASTVGKIPEIATEICNLLRAQALNVFIQGLIEPLRLHLKARNPGTLEDAIELAREEERQLLCQRNKTFPTYFHSKPQVTCNICKKAGHVDRNCYFKQSTTQGANDNRKQLHSQRTYSIDTRNQNFNCLYCKKPGHRIAECRKRMYNESQKNNSQTSGNASRPSPSGRPTVRRY